MSIHLEQEVADFSERRMRLATAITDYADWLDRQHGIDAERTLRLADTASTLRQDKLVVAFVAEFSRGKTELINALFFADHGQRLLAVRRRAHHHVPDRIVLQSGRSPQPDACCRLKRVAAANRWRTSSACRSSGAGSRWTPPIRTSCRKA